MDTQCIRGQLDTFLPSPQNLVLCCSAHQYPIIEMLGPGLVTSPAFWLRQISYLSKILMTMWMCLHGQSSGWKTSKQRATAPNLVSSAVAIVHYL